MLKRLNPRWIVALGLCWLGSFALGQAVDPLGQWGQWRGPLATGAAPRANPPVEWSETKNVRWKTKLPGLGHSSPVVWGGLVYVTTAEQVGPRKPFTGPVPEGAHNNMDPESDYQFAVMAIDRQTGGVTWRRTVATRQPHESTHESATWASNSPVTDGEHVIAFFGSNGLYCLDTTGRLAWWKDLGDMRVKHGHGEGASPALHGETVVVNWDHEGASFIVALAKRTGEERWRQPRDEVTSWATPIVVEQRGQAQVVVSGTKRVRGYDLETGRVIWEAGGLPGNIVASPVAANGVVFAAGSYEKQTLLAIRLEGAKGELSGSKQIVWRKNRSTPYVPSPLLHGDWLYYLRHYQGVLSRVNATSGDEPSGPFRLGPLFNIYASPVAAAGRIYVTDRNGKTVVLSSDAEPRALALNELDERFSASAALAGDAMFLRGEKFLYCIGEPDN
ncbi:MAG: PQQ-binding-like beta-propeller repeat protein [Verrucomicrobia bacterium]|nr:PQQ-binding-like beta-propeller repeat protein [Verrucomicrobiota bacterium]